MHTFSTIMSKPRTVDQYRQMQGNNLVWSVSVDNGENECRLEGETF